MHWLQQFLQYECSFTCRSYSGRGMQGKECFAVVLQDRDALWHLACEIGGYMGDFTAPKTDNLGESIVAYWPEVPYTQEVEEE